MGATSDSEKVVNLSMPISLWSWCREEALKVGARGVKPYVLSLVEDHRRQGGVGKALSGEDGGVDAAKLTNRELTDKKQKLIDDWVLSRLEDVATLDSLPKQTQAAIILARLPKMGVSKGEMEEKALSLRAALKGIGDYEDIQGEMVTLREEVLRLQKSCELLEAELSMASQDAEFCPEETVRKFFDLSAQWRDMIRESLMGRESARRCGMLREDKLLEVWKKAAVDIAGISVELSLVTDIDEDKKDGE